MHPIARSTARMLASLINVYKSAPTYPGVNFTSSSKGKSGLSLIPFVNTFKIEILASSFGTPNVISLSNRPARLKP